MVFIRYYYFQHCLTVGFGIVLSFPRKNRKMSYVCVAIIVFRSRGSQPATLSESEPFWMILPLHWPGKAVGDCVARKWKQRQTWQFPRPSYFSDTIHTEVTSTPIPCLLLTPSACSNPFTLTSLQSGSRFSNLIWPYLCQRPHIALRVRLRLL